MDSTSEVTPKDMGITGLLRWVASHVERSSQLGLARATAKRVIRHRYGPAATERFERALQVEVDAAWAKWRATRAIA